MEATGVYGIPLFEHLERGGSSAGSSSRASRTAAAPGPRPTSPTASGCHGCTPTACSRPRSARPSRWRALRAYHRQRQTVIRHAAAHVRHVRKALNDECQADRSPQRRHGRHGPADRPGDPGRRTRGARPGGVGLAQVRQDQRRGSRRPCKARGSRGARFEPQRAHDPFETYRRPVDECDRRIEAELATQPDRAGDKPPPHKPRRTAARRTTRASRRRAPCSGRLAWT